MAPVKLSVIVPVYNALSFVANCLDSVLAQGLPNMEILCIDDGSTDGSAAILDDYAARHPALCRVEHRANGGASVARNAGLDACRGQYIAFVDADDWIAPDFLGRLLDLALRHDLDMAHGNGIFHFEGRQADYPIYALDLPPDVMPGREAMRRRLGKRAFLHYPVLQVYRRAFVERVGLRFIPGRLHEDVLWTTQAFLQADSVAYDGQPGYFYRRQPRTAPATAEGRDAALRDQIESAAANAVGLTELMATIAGDAELHRLMGWQVVDGALSIFHMLPRIAAPGLKRQVYRQLRATGFFGLLWRHAVDAAQRRRIAKTWLRSWFS